MRVIAFRGEGTVGAIANKVYRDLSPASRRKAVAALLRANPQLERLERVQPGTVLRVPDVPGVRVKPARGPEDPEDEIADLLAKRLAEYGKSTIERHEVFESDMKEQASLLSDRKFRKALEASPAAQKLAASAKKAIQAQTKEAAATRKRLEAALEKLIAELSRR